MKFKEQVRQCFIISNLDLVRWLEKNDFKYFEKDGEDLSQEEVDEIEEAVKYYSDKIDEALKDGN